MIALTVWLIFTKTLKHKNTIKLIKVELIELIVSVEFIGNQVNKNYLIRINRINRVKSTKSQLHVHFFRHYSFFIYVFYLFLFM